MKKKICLLLIGTGVLFQLPLFSRTVYVTRHGQVGYPMKEIRETRLTELGAAQARALAEFLVSKRKFNGTIYVSPFYRTVETASFTGKLLKKKLILEPGIQEVATGKSPSPPGMNFAQIDAYFPGLTVPGRRFTEKWRLCNESHAQRRLRVAEALDAILAEERGDLLLVGHGASVGDLVRILNSRNVPGRKKQVRGTTWNCALYIFELDDENRVTDGAYTTSYMTERDLTNNFRAPKIERPEDPRYMTRARDRADRAARAAKAARPKAADAGTTDETAKTQK